MKLLPDAELLQALIIEMARQAETADRVAQVVNADQAERDTVLQTVQAENANQAVAADTVAQAMKAENAGQAVTVIAEKKAQQEDTAEQAVQAEKADQAQADIVVQVEKEDQAQADTVVKVVQTENADQVLADIVEQAVKADQALVDTVAQVAKVDQAVIVITVNQPAQADITKLTAPRAEQEVQLTRAQEVQNRHTENQKAMQEKRAQVEQEASKSLVTGQHERKVRQ